mgnify:CR=1 FL=1
MVVHREVVSGGRVELVAPIVLTGAGVSCESPWQQDWARCDNIFERSWSAPLTHVRFLLISAAQWWNPALYSAVLFEPENRMINDINSLFINKQQRYSEQLQEKLTRALQRIYKSIMWSVCMSKTALKFYLFLKQKRHFPRH